ncbi:cell surface protein SprA [Hymenobacter sp. NBH84]|uniref:T9SS outer membrane translocon Sov/SprA n=1 Tax=Hymenobacter sp. NBH84 TaxID=2596915 RepID=UPI0021564A7C|nr:cell surface protein SprA [Hymenobacter sp. NBH84]
MSFDKKHLSSSLVLCALLVTWWSQAKPLSTNATRLHQLLTHLPVVAQLLPDTPRVVLPDTSRYRPSSRPKVAPADRQGITSPTRRRSPLLLDQPANVKPEVVASDSLDYYDLNEKIGSDIDYRNPSRMTFEEYSRFRQQQAVRDYYREKAAGGVTGGANTPATAQRLIPKIYLGPMADRIFGGSYVDIRPQGAVTLRMGARFNRNENPTLTLRQQRTGDFNYEQNMNLNLTGQIGEKMRVTFNYDTKAAFEFENNMKLDYTGYETEIIRKVELGNVSLPLNNSLITGGQNLFGVKAQLQFGRLGVTAVASTLRGQQDAVTVQNGGQSRNFEIKASQYENNRHFFLSQFFRDRYNAALRNLPTVQSGIEIRRLEVYVTNDNRTATDLRNVVTLMDLAEPFRVYRPQFLQGNRTTNTPPGNGQNTEYEQVRRDRGNLTVDNSLNALGLVKATDFERVRARKLAPTEYTFNAQLGYLSLNTQLLPEQVLGVSYEYLYNGQVYKVGELVDDYASVNADQVIFLKMLKATNPGVGLADPNVNPQNPNLLTRNLPTWDLLMKNVYSLNATQLNRENFQLQVVYKDDVTGVDLISLKEGQNVQNVPLIQVLNLDNLNPNNDRNADGNFDFISGITIDPTLGRIYFPEVEPFGNYLQNQFVAGTEQGLIDKYVYSALYNQVQSDAQQVQDKDKFFLRGRYQATSTDVISLPGFGIAQGSVRVYAGSTLLQEGVDYQVFYDQAQVKILNPSYLNSANELRITFEKNAVVQVQPRRLIGTRLDYRLSPDINFGATMLKLIENQAPGINRVAIGDEPNNNTIYGFDVNMRRESRALTKYLDMLPGLSTKAPSSVAFSGEFAQLLPGKTELGRGENGVSYLDDFENARTPYTLAGLNSATVWRLGTTPLPIQGSQAQGLPFAYRRAKLAWYTVDQTYYSNGPSKPSSIGAQELRNHYVRGIPRTEIFPARDVGATGNGFELPLDLAYFPTERGQYNYNPQVGPDGRSLPLGLAQGNYGAISREITFDTDFDNANVEYIEFWMMDPFIQSNNGNNVIRDGVNETVASANPGGDFYINLGSVSEDVLRNNNINEFENGLPDGVNNAPNLTQNTVWGRATTQQFLTDAFSAANGARALQDVGLDGVNNTAEKALGVPGPFSGLDDPAGDDFLHHLSGQYDGNPAGNHILGRYKQYNGMEGNSTSDTNQSSTAYPDKEDLNRDNVVTDLERYYEYRLQIRPNNMVVGQNYIVDKVTRSIAGSNGESVSWYQFRVPVRQYSAVRGTPNGQPFGFKSIRFVRLYLTQWQQPVVLRLVQPQFVANQWRRFLSTIATPGQPVLNNDTDAEGFAISTVSLEENGASANTSGAIPYVLPPGIQRDQEYGSSTVNRRQNEQSLRLTVDGLRDGYGKAAYKNIQISLLRYKQLRMFLHAETQEANVNDGDVRAFIRIGTDYTQNYYEYSLPLQLTRPGASTTSEIWPDANQIQVAFQDFINAKAARNAVAVQNNLGSEFYFTPFTYTENLPTGATITVVGNPDFSQVQGAMIGVFNPLDNGVSKSVTVWADEFRVFEFDRKSAWAATARFNTQLADVANVTATGSYVTSGFGGLQDKLQQRTTSDIMRGDVNATIAADRFLPEKLGLRLPVLVQAGSEVSKPEYDPLDPDTKLSQSLQKFGSDRELRREYEKEVVSQTSQRSISVLNAHKERTDPQKPVRPYDIENFAVSYAITERTHTDINTDKDYTRTFTGALAYVYQTTPKNYTPLAGLKALDSPYLKFLQEVNFTPLPSRFSFRADLDRRYNERFLQRVLEPGTLPVSTGAGIFQKSFYFNRIYDLKWDLTKSLILDYTANNRAIVDEGVGRAVGGSDQAQQNRDLIRDNLLRGGRTTNFTQLVAVTWRVPLDKFPLTDWVSINARYSANYTWQAASTALRVLRDPYAPLTSDSTTLGNTIQNNGELSGTGKIDLVKLYNKVRFLNIINNAPPPPPVQRDEKGRIIKPKPTPPGAPGVAGAPADTTRKAPEFRALKAVLRSLMTARSLDFTYTRSNGTLLPGYLPSTQFFGMNNSFDAPGIPFILGKQYSKFTELDMLYQRAASNGWYTERSDLLNTPLSSLLTDNLTLRTSLQPFRDFNIQLDARQQRVRNREVFYRRAIDEETLLPVPGAVATASNPLGSGSFSTSFISIQTLFGDRSAEGTISKAFNRFVQNRAFVYDRLTAANTAPGVYSYNSQDVLLPAFLDAYRGKSSDGYEAKGFNPTKQFNVPLPNWTIQYNGLAQLPFVQRYFRSVTLKHAYTSVYSINSYTTSTLYKAAPDDNDFSTVTNNNNLFVPYYILGQVTISEQLAPLIGINFQTLQKVSGNLEYRVTRNVGLNTINAQVTELHTTEMVIGFGYVTDRLKLPFRIGGEQKVLRNQLNARLDMSIRDNTIIQRTIEDVVDGSDVGTPFSLVTSGTRQVLLRPTIDYTLNQRLNLQFYFTRTVTAPRVQNSFRNAATEGGIQLRYSLSQ